MIFEDTDFLMNKKRLQRCRWISFLQRIGRISSLKGKEMKERSSRESKRRISDDIRKRLGTKEILLTHLSFYGNSKVDSSVDNEIVDYSTD